MDTTTQQYSIRRQNFANKLIENSIAILPANSNAIRNGDSDYLFRQDSNFYYLTGCNESNAVLVIINEPRQCLSMFFSRPHNTMQEQWVGLFLGQDGACQILGMDSAFSIYELDDQLSTLFANKNAVYFSINNHYGYEKNIKLAYKNTKQK